MVGRGTVGRASRIDQDLPLLWARITAPVMASSARDTKGDRHMAQSFLGQKRLRKYYGKIREVLEMPNLIEVQKSSYDLFLRSGDAETPTDGDGIQGVFQSVFPIKDFNETSVLEYVKYELEKPKYDDLQCAS